jgi:hypothetical protein
MNNEFERKTITGCGARIQRIVRVENELSDTLGGNCLPFGRVAGRERSMPSGGKVIEFDLIKR